MVGGKLLSLLLDDPAYTKIFSVGRRALALHHPKLSHRAVDFARLGALPPVDDVFCALGTTIKKARTKQAFRAVDFDAVLALAEGARAAGAERFFLVSSLGADASSPIFYSRVKGEIERAVAGLGYEAVFLLRPSVLLGERGEARLKEKLLEAGAALAKPLLVGRLRKYRAIDASVVARAALALARGEGKGVTIVESDELQALG